MNRRIFLVSLVTNFSEHKNLLSLSLQESRVTMHCIAMSHALCWCERVKDSLQMGQTWWVRVSAWWWASPHEWSTHQHHLSDVHRILATWADDDNDNYLVAWFGLTATIETLDSAGGRELQQAGAITLQFPIQHHTRDLGQWQLCSAPALQSECESCSRN